MMLHPVLPPHSSSGVGATRHPAVRAFTWGQTLGVSISREGHSPSRCKAAFVLVVVGKGKSWVGDSYLPFPSLCCSTCWSSMQMLLIEKPVCTRKNLKLTAIDPRDLNFCLLFRNTCCPLIFRQFSGQQRLSLSPPPSYEISLSSVSKSLNKIIVTYIYIDHLDFLALKVLFKS